LVGNYCPCYQAEGFGKDSAYLGEEMKKGREAPFFSAVAHAAKPLARFVC